MKFIKNLIEDSLKIYYKQIVDIEETITSELSFCGDSYYDTFIYAQLNLYLSITKLKIKILEVFK